MKCIILEVHIEYALLCYETTAFSKDTTKDKDLLKHGHFLSAMLNRSLPSVTK